MLSRILFILSPVVGTSSLNGLIGDVSPPTGMKRIFYGDHQRAVLWKEQALLQGSLWKAKVLFKKKAGGHLAVPRASSL